MIYSCLAIACSRAPIWRPSARAAGWQAAWPAPLSIPIQWLVARAVRPALIERPTTKTSRKPSARLDLEPGGSLAPPIRPPRRAAPLDG